jgi:hypothetical protein
MTAAIAIDHLNRTLQVETIGTAYIYFNYNDPQFQDISAVLASILKQLLWVRPSSVEHVSRLYKHHFQHNTRPSVEEITTALRSVIADYSRVYLVVDALDECLNRNGTRGQLLSNLRELQQKTDLNLMVTSRSVPDVEEEFKLTPKLDIRANDEDVRRYVKGQIYRLPMCIRSNSELQNLVLEKISGAADGMLGFFQRPI